MTTIMDMPKLPSKRPRLSNYDHKISSSHPYSKKRYSAPIKSEEDLDIPTSKYDFMSESERTEEIKYCQKDIYQFKLFTEAECKKLEDMIDDVVERARNNEYKKYTVDSTPLRTKYFFGEGYTYGVQMKKPGPNQERLYAKGDVDDIPSWVYDLVINPLLKSKLLDSLLPKDKEHFFNSVVINDYAKGGCIAPHIDPIHIFCRPIITISLTSNSYLSFGCRFAYHPMRSSKPLIKLPVKRGVITSISGYAADNITHCVCPEDVTSRRTVIILRRVCDDAPRLPPCSDENLNSKNEKANSFCQNSNLDDIENCHNSSEKRAKDSLKNNYHKVDYIKKNHKLEEIKQLRESDQINNSKEKKKIDSRTLICQHSRSCIDRNKKKSKSNSVIRETSINKNKMRLLDDNNNQDEVKVNKSHSSRRCLRNDRWSRSTLKSKASRQSSEESVNISGKNYRFNKKHKRSQSSDDEDKSIIVKRKNKKFRVKVQSNDL